MPEAKRHQRLDLRRLVGLCSLMTLASCTQHHALSTHEVHKEAFYGTSARGLERTNHIDGVDDRNENPSREYSFTSQPVCSELNFSSLPYHYRADKPLLLTNGDFPGRQQMRALFSDDLPLSPGDMIELTLINGEGFEGRYIVNPDGKIQLPLVNSITAAGLQLEELADQIELALVRQELFRPNTARIGLRVLQWAPIEVSVSGAVFEPGRVLINDKLPAQVMEERIAAFGDYAPSRYLSEALRAASGIRPDAKPDQVILIRNGWQIEVDLSGVLSGQSVQDIPLVAGDRIVVPTTGCFQHQLARPSQITPKGFRVFMSNLTKPSDSNSDSAIGKFSSSLPYGTRLLQAAVSANCVGGTSWTNAPRKVLLASKNPLTGRTEVIERSVEQLVRQAERDEMNPYLMPNDAIACYDSDVTNVRDVARSILEIIAPIKLL